MKVKLWGKTCYQYAYWAMMPDISHFT